MSALDRLIEAVEEGNSFGIIPLGQEAIGPEDYSYKQGDLVCNAFSGSIDAALALHKALLPGWRLVELGEAPCTSSGWCAILRLRDAAGSARAFDQPSAARALLLAILRAYRQQRESGE